MLLKREVLDLILAGRVDRQFRIWKRPTVKTGGTLTTAVGVLAIDTVESMTLDALEEEDARRSGFTSLEALKASLDGREGQLYRIRLRYAEDDPRLELRRAPITSREDLEAVKGRLRRMDRASASGPWTEAYLCLIRDNEGTRAPELAERVGLDTSKFKARVRRLKALGLTESLRIGYRLSPRGQSYLGSSKALSG